MEYKYIANQKDFREKVLKQGETIKILFFSFQETDYKRAEKMASDMVDKINRIKKIEEFFKKEINKNIKCYLVFDNTDIGNRLLEKYQDIGWGVGTILIFNEKGYLLNDCCGIHIEENDEYKELFDKTSNVFNWINKTICNKGV